MGSGGAGSLANAGRLTARTLPKPAFRRLVLRPRFRMCGTKGEHGPVLCIPERNPPAADRESARFLRAGLMIDGDVLNTVLSGHQLLQKRSKSRDVPVLVGQLEYRQSEYVLLSKLESLLKRPICGSHLELFVEHQDRFLHYVDGFEQVRV